MQIALLELSPCSSLSEQLKANLLEGGHCLHNALMKRNAKMCKIERLDGFMRRARINTNRTSDTGNSGLCQRQFPDDGSSFGREIDIPLLTLA